MSKLRILLLNGNTISTFTIGNWPNLEILELTHNNLIHGPLLSMTPQQYIIKELGLGINQLHDFNSDLAKISTITTLGISQNKLMKVDSIAQLSNLEVLNIADNKIVDISALSALTKLKTLTYYDNPLANGERPVQPSSVCRN